MTNPATCDLPKPRDLDLLFADFPKFKDYKNVDLWKCAVLDWREKAEELLNESREEKEAKLERERNRGKWKD